MYDLSSEFQSYSYQTTLANLYGAPLHHSSPVLSTTATWRPDASGFDTQSHGLMSFDRNEPNRIAIRRPTTRWSRFNISPLDQATLVDLVEYDTNNTPFDVQNNTAPADTNQVKHPPTFMSKFHAYLRDKVAHFKQPKLKNASTELEALRSQLSVKDKIIEEMKTRANNTCPICLEDNKEQVVFNPCGHCSCHACAVKLVHCHSCREYIKNRIKIFY